MKKTFDCVRMKWDIQRELRKEEEGLSLEDRQTLMRKRILADPIIGPWFRKVIERDTPHAASTCVAESRAPYGQLDSMPSTKTDQQTREGRGRGRRGRGQT